MTRPRPRTGQATATADFGVVYCAVNTAKHVRMAVSSALLLRRAGYPGPMTVLSDQPVSPRAASTLRTLGLEIARVEAPPIAAYAARFVKSSLWDRSPYDVTLYLDVDVLAARWTGEIVDFLDDRGIALAIDRYPEIAALPVDELRWCSREEWTHTVQVVGPTRHYNSGVVLFAKTERTKRLFDAWHSEWRKFRQVDQLPLLRALHSTATVPALLPPSFNCPGERVDSLGGARSAGVSLVHCMGQQEQAHVRMSPETWRDAGAILS